MLPIIKISVVVFALFALTCSAFVPTTKHSVMAHGHYHLRALDGMAFEPLGSFSRMPTTTLSMVNNGNLFDRFTRVVKSNINKFVSSIENPEKVIVQAVDDMQVSPWVLSVLLSV